MVRDRRVSRQRAEDQATPRCRLDPPQRESVNVDHLVGVLDVELHQIDQRRAACKKRTSAYCCTVWTGPPPEWLHPLWSAGCTEWSAFSPSVGE